MKHLTLPFSIMNSKHLNKEEKKIYEEEFSEFLIQKIKFFGGSSKIQQLSACLTHARFELRDAFGTTNSDLVKFLKAHPKRFLVDSKGTISILVSGDDSDDFDNTKSTESERSWPSKIENGSGIIVKVHPEFGIIKATEPVGTYVHFKSLAFSGSADTLLMDSHLEIGDEVYFNAYCGHEMFDFKYRASKVWRMLDKNENPDESYKENVVPDNLEGEGVIQKLFSNLGFILVSGRKDETVFFHRNTLRDCDNMELTQFLNVGDRVEFSASRSDKKDSRAQWQARVVRKKAKKEDGVPSSSHTEAKVSVATVKNDAVKNRLEDEPGRISPYSQGAVIKFGKNYSERATGDSNKYFLYGTEVSDIDWEFSEGDDVCFNAIKIKSPPGWKAVLVWVGEKPSWININQLFADEELKELAEDKSCASSSDISTSSYSPSLRNKGTKSKSGAPFRTERVMQNRNKPFEHSVTKKDPQSDRKRDSKSSKDPRSFSASKSSNKKRWNELRNKNSSINKSKGNHHRTATGLERGSDKISSRDDEDYMDNLSCKDDISAISDGSFQNDKSQGLLQDRRNGVKKRYGSLARASDYDFSSSDENNSDNAYNEIKYKSDDNRKPGIKKFEDIYGEIIHLYCKVAIIRSSQLQKEVNFVLNALYLNGKPAEEQEVNDLKEVFKVGDNIKFNCFEIIDDSGEIHQKVTTAWKGSKPKVYEMTPEEFIDEYDLSVTMSDELVSECVPQRKTKNVAKERYRDFARASRCDRNSDKNDSDNACNEIKRYKSEDNRKPSIKRFEDIDGEIINLYCKAAIIRSSQLQKEVNFVLNALYLNGEPAEEQEVNDLKEIFKVGDNIKFNCFEIIDDSGEIHQKVTTAWKGSKPKVYEMTPEEFIDDYDLSVTMSDDVVTECVPKNKTKNVAKERYRGFARSSRNDLSDENDNDNACNEIEHYKSADNRKPSIKKFNDIDGKIVNLYCKAAIIKSSCLQKEIDFLINVFYLNGKSAEEQEVIDLKDIFKVGDSVKFNCFEIIDDSREIHRKVTLAWKGPKPKVYEITPEEFINEHDLTVTVS